MNKSGKKVIALIAVTAALVCAITASTYAYWLNAKSVDIDDPGGGFVGEFDNNTPKYLVYTITGAVDGETKSVRVRYRGKENGAEVWEFDSARTQKYGGASAGEMSTVLAASGVKATVYGYTGTLGATEPLIIPSKVNVADGASVKVVNVEEIEFMTPEEFPALDIIREVYVGAGVKRVRGASFGYWDNLIKVSFAESEAAVNIAATCFADNKTAVEIVYGSE